MYKVGRPICVVSEESSLAVPTYYVLQLSKFAWSQDGSSTIYSPGIPRVVRTQLGYSPTGF
jgi:hypothetical protein